MQKMFLKISQNWQRNTCFEVSFLIKLIKQETPTQVFFSEFFKIFKITHFYKTLSWLLLKFQRSWKKILKRQKGLCIVISFNWCHEPTSRRQIHKKADYGMQPGLLIYFYHKFATGKWLHTTLTMKLCICIIIPCLN